MKILYVGDVDNPGTCLQRLHVLRELGHEVVELNSRYPLGRFYRVSLRRILRKLGYHVDRHGTNRKIIELASGGSFDLLWIDKGEYIRPETLHAFKRLYPAAKCVSYSLDDMMNPGNSSVGYRHCVPLFDLHVTTKSYNAREFLEQGARHSLFVTNAYNRHTHRPLELTPEEWRVWGADVSFIGGYERQRAEQIRAVAESGVAVVVYCPDWDAELADHPKITLFRKMIFDDDYAKAICATKINLGFLRKVNRDLQTTRSVEIPACGGFMLAERTDEHLAMFAEGTEAAYFADTTELIEKCQYYLEHEDERRQIAHKGRERCLAEGYSYHEQIQRVLNVLATQN